MFIVETKQPQKTSDFQKTNSNNPKQKHGLIIYKNCSMNELIIQNIRIQGGLPVIKGTRIPVATIRGMYESGDSIELLCDLYDLSKDQVKACINYEPN